METTNALIRPSTVADGSACHGADRSSGSSIGRWRGLAIAGVVIAVGMTVAFSQHWLAVASLAPLLFVLPCAVMMFICMKSMDHGQETGTKPASARDQTAPTTDARN